MEPSKAVKEYKEELVKSQKQNERLTALVGKNAEVYLVRFLLIFFTPIFLFSLTCSK
jgi:hypothetical protein